MRAASPLLSEERFLVIQHLVDARPADAERLGDGSGPKALRDQFVPARAASCLRNARIILIVRRVLTYGSTSVTLPRTPLCESSNRDATFLAAIEAPEVAGLASSGARGTHCGCLGAASLEAPEAAIVEGAARRQMLQIGRLPRNGAQLGGDGRVEPRGGTQQAVRIGMLRVVEDVA